MIKTLSVIGFSIMTLMGYGQNLNNDAARAKQNVVITQQNSGGNNAQNVINGDVNLTVTDQPWELGSIDKINLLKIIDELLSKRHHDKSFPIGIGSPNFEKSLHFANQIRDFLATQGYAPAKDVSIMESMYQSVICDIRYFDFNGEHLCITIRRP